MSVTNKTDSAVTLLTSKLNTLKAMYDVLDAQVAALTPRVVGAAVESQNVNDSGPILFGATSRSDASWSHADGTNAFAVSGSPGEVVISLMVSFGIASSANIQRPAPVIELSKNGVVVASARTGYIRDTSGHEEASGTITWIDEVPGTDPTYTVTSRMETTRAGTVTADLGHFSAIATG